jgi:hypothetical protein
MMAGGILAFVKRTREARRAVLSAEAADRARSESPVTATGPAVPAHTRSTT